MKKRYVLVNGAPNFGLGEVVADLMAESPAAAVREYDADAGDAGAEYIEHPPTKVSGFRHGYSTKMGVYELPGKSVDGLWLGDVSVKFIESVGEKVAVVERVG